MSENNDRVLWSSRWVRWTVALVILTSCIGCDQATKRIAREQLRGQPPQSFLGDTLRLQYAENPGAFLGLGGEMPPAARFAALVLFNAVLAAGIAAVLIWSGQIPAWRLAGCALLLSGAVGNLIDRLRFDGLVTDFLNLGVGPLRTGIFNVADMAITCGAVLMVWPIFSTAPHKDPAPTPAE